jgi:hypothetical protein
MDTQTQIDRLIELAIVQRSELKQLVSELPQLREYLGAEIERTFEETEPQIRTELEEFCRARASDEHAKTGAALAAKVEQLSKQLEVTTAAKYSVLMAERLENANLLAKAEARIEDAASMLSHAVKEIVTDELSRFPRAGEIDQLRKEFAEPRGLNPRGRWLPDETYQRLDLVTINGDSFVSNIDGNRERPSRTAGDWTLSAARGNGGGGGVTSLTDLVSVPSNGQLLIGNGSGFVNSTLTAGTGISISNGAGSITISATDGNITLDDGTAAAPSLNFTDDPNTGLYRPAADTVGIVGGGHDILRLTDIASATDYVQIKNGIGVGSPIHILAEGASANIGMHLQPKGSGLLTISDGTDFNKGIRFRSSSSAASAVTLIDAVSTAGRVITLPDATDTLVGKATTDTLTNKTLTAPTINTITAPAATNLTLAGGTAGSDSVVVSNTLAASSSIIGAFKVGNGTAATNVAIGGGAGYFGAGVAVSGPATLATGYGGTVLLSSGESGAISRFYMGDGSGWSFRIASRTGSVTTDRFTFADNGTLTVSGTTASTSFATGALVVAGGVGVAGASYFGGAVTLSSTAVGSAGAGALVMTGGLSAANGGGTSYFGGKVNLATHTTSVGGIGFGTDISLFRLDANTLKVQPTGSSSPILLYGDATQGGGAGISGVFNALASFEAVYFDPTAHSLILATNGTTKVTIASAGAVRFHAYGAGAATFDSSGNITSVSDARLKNITGTFTKGLAEIVKLTPKLYTWKPETGLVTDDINATLIAQDLIAAGLSEAVATYRTVPVMEDDVQSAEDIAAGKPVTQHAKLDANGKAVTERIDANYSVSDRTVIAALVNAVKELKAEIDALKAAK